METYVETPVGWLQLRASEQALHAIQFIDHKPSGGSQQHNAVIDQVIQELSEYFDGQRTEFSVPLEPEGSDFQQMVWQCLPEIPFGQTISYGRLAKKLGDPNKVRAVGKANGQNPIPIIIPCHRVIGANNDLTGYSGGIAKKKFLLQHEGAILM